MKKITLIILTMVSLFAISSCEKDDKSIVELSCDVTYTNVTEYGGNDGSIKITINKGNGNYTIDVKKDNISIYNLNSTNDKVIPINNLSYGVYNVSVTDKESKKYLTSITITQPNPLTITITITSQTNVTCYGRSTGSFTVTASGESGNYEYKIGNGTYQNNGTFSNLSAGTYTVTVKSGTVTTTKDITITQPNQLSLTSSVTNPTTVGGNGQITLTTSGGTLPYNYQLNSGTFQSSNVFNATAGTYTATVKDGCNDTKTINNIVVTNPVIAPTVNILIESNITSTSVTINADVNTNGASTNVYVKYGTSATSLTNTTSTITLTNSTTVNINLTGLTSNTVYYYRVFASNGGGSASSGVYSFTTSVPTYNIGDELYGGVIFYVDGTGQHGKIVQKTDESAGTTWTNVSITRNGATWVLPSWDEMKQVYINSIVNSKITPLSGSYWTKNNSTPFPGEKIYFDTNQVNNNTTSAPISYNNKLRLITTF